MEITPVTSASLFQKFINLPYELYRCDRHWIPPLIMDQKNIFNPKKNNMLHHCDYQLFLLFDQNEVLGRIAVYVNRAANEYWQTKVGFFGHYECVDDASSARALLQTAENWLVQRNMNKMSGPWNLVSQDMGFICEGFEIAPIILSSYNPDYYNQQVHDFGMQKAKDLLVYNCDLSQDYKIPERFLRLTDKIAERYQVTVRPIRLKNMLEDARIIVDLTNRSLQDNWGYYPVDVREAEQIAADLKMIVHPEVVLIAEIMGEPIGYIITLPDVNTILKNMNGRLLPFGIFKLLRGIKKINRYRIWAMGLLKPYQKKGISVLMFRRLNEILAPKKSYVEANWVLEDNHLMNNSLKQLNFEMVKRYRIYEKKIG